MTSTKTKFHRDGTITYWSVYRQQWISKVEPAEVPDAELAQMNQRERERITKAQSA